MGLGNRNARQHDTLAAQAVVSADYADFTEGQRVRTVDGITGTVAAIEDGPYPGTESYRVELDKGLGGGLYSSGQLAAVEPVIATHEHMASDDYPELGDILTRRPDIAKG